MSGEERDRLQQARERLGWPARPTHPASSSRLA